MKDLDQIADTAEKDVDHAKRAMLRAGAGSLAYGLLRATLGAVGLGELAAAAGCGYQRTGRRSTTQPTIIELETLPLPGFNLYLDGQLLQPETLGGNEYTVYMGAGVGEGKLFSVDVTDLGVTADNFDNLYVNSVDGSVDNPVLNFNGLSQATVRQVTDPTTNLRRTILDLYIEARHKGQETLEIGIDGRGYSQIITFDVK